MRINKDGIKKKTSVNSGLFSWRQKLADLLLLAALLAFYLVLYHILDFQTYDDSVQYIQMHIRREPGYPLWLWLFRALLHGDAEDIGANYLRVAGFWQCVLNAVVNWYCAIRLSKIFNRGWVYKAAVALLGVLAQLATMLASANHIYLAGSILSESLSIPLFYLFVLQLIGMLQKGTPASEHARNISSDAESSSGSCLKHEVRSQYLGPLANSHTWLALLLGLILSLIRSQFMAMLIAWFLVLCWCILRDKTLRNRQNLVLLAVVFTMVVFGMRSTLVKAYSYATTGVYSTNSNLWNMSLAYVLYNADDSMSSAFTDDIHQGLFDQMMERMDEQELGYRYEPAGITDGTDFLEDCYDPIKFNVIENTLYDFANRFTEDYQQQNVIENQISQAILKTILPLTWQKFAVNYLRLGLRGLWRSILAAGRAASPLAAAVYMLTLALMIALERDLRRGSEMGVSRVSGESGFGRDNSKEPECGSYLTVPTLGLQSMGVILLLILGNSFGTALVSADLGRYMIYTFAPFYACLLNLLITCRQALRQNRPTVRSN